MGPYALVARACLGIYLALAAFLVFFYLRMILPFVALPADILMWGENGFVAATLRLRLGEPLYGPPGDSNSMIYSPLAPLFTYGISRLLGSPDSLAVLRGIQLGFVTMAALAGTHCWWLLRRLAYPDHELAFRKTWRVLVFLILFLAGVSDRVNSFTFCLHPDALALLVSMLGFWSALRYLHAPGPARLLCMALVPAAALVTKQLLLSWFAVLLVCVLLHRLAASPWRPALHAGAGFAAAAALILAGALGVCAWVWGSNFLFWVFQVLGGQSAEAGLRRGAY